jgi:hypothetical protein
MNSGTSHQGFVHLSACGVVHILPSLLQCIEALCPVIIVIRLHPVIAPAHTGKSVATVRGNVVQERQRSKRLCMLILEEKEKAYGWLRGLPGSLRLRKKGGLTHH